MVSPYIRQKSTVINSRFLTGDVNACSGQRDGIQFCEEVGVKLPLRYLIVRSYSSLYR